MNIEQPLVTMIATDLDGTLLDSHKQVSAETRKVLRELKNRGILFGIASGRPVESGQILVHDWGLENDISFLIGMNGGALYDMRTKAKHKYYPLSGDKILEIMEHFKDMDVIFQCMLGNDRFVSKSTEKTRAHAKLFCEHEHEVDLQEFLPGREIDKLILFLDPELMPAVRQRATTFSDPAYTSMQTADNLYEYMDPRINKGFGIEKACKHYGITPDHVVAFGDAENDEAMIETVGLGVAMANASDELKKIADVVLKETNDQDGLAHFVENVVLPANTDRLEHDANARLG
ncbi:Cof-type HAD-IIB family hydrolase [Faecalibaculum rodentium]|uniref:Cof-like hydrolase n=2 Tax=Faecalibaculum rodentium TaxID=1702221 RepID=A0A140DVZ2_9FIRM|nr:Cof-type HAD-IIB family hydrolase [Faecalibaculum rodentium]AMK54819.1 cof-like hydrolase [Faecalibaculum rodentium]